MTTRQISSFWVTEPKINSRAKLRLFCFPYAGGGALSFRSWSKNLPSSIEVCSVELPGRGRRLMEPAFTQLEPLLQELVRALLPYLDKQFTFFGHSMGGLVSFELAHLCQKDYGLSPMHLFISGRRAPQVPASGPAFHTLPEPEFLNELRRLNGTPEAVLESSEFMKRLLPTLRADFAILETYVYDFKPRLDVPITVFGGLQDSTVRYSELAAWREQTNNTFSLQMLPGDHFFIHSSQLLLLQFLFRELQVWSHN